jgi:hypothetical protein
MKTGKLAMIILLLVWLTSLNASVYDFLNVGFSARPNAMGGSFTAISHDVTALQSNPAGLQGIGKGMLSTGIVLYIADIKFGHVQYGFSRGKNSFGVGINYVSYGSMERRGENNEDLGTFSPMDFVFLAGYSRPFSENLSAGLEMKLVYEKIDSFASYGAAADIGMQYLMKERYLTIGLVLKNAGTVFKPHDEIKGALPLAFTGGFSFHPLPILSFNLDVTQIFSDSRTVAKFGVEWWTVSLLALRAGYSNAGSELKTGYGSDMLAGLSAGFGVSWKRMKLDYAVQPMVDFGFAHSISLSHIF